MLYLLEEPVYEPTAEDRKRKKRSSLRKLNQQSLCYQVYNCATPTAQLRIQ